MGKIKTINSLVTVQVVLYRLTSKVKIWLPELLGFHCGEATEGLSGGPQPGGLTGLLTEGPTHLCAPDECQEPRSPCRGQGPSCPCKHACARATHMHTRAHIGSMACPSGPLSFSQGWKGPQRQHLNPLEHPHQVVTQFLLPQLP